MSSAKLLLAGSMVSSGLVLGAFTLHGAFDPQRPQRQVPAAVPHENTAKAANAFQTKTRFVTRESAPRDPASRAVKTGAPPNAKAPNAKAADAKAAAARAAARRRLAQKRRAEKQRAEKAEKERIAKAKEQPQQASFKWPWNW